MNDFKGRTVTVNTTINHEEAKAKREMARKLIEKIKATPALLERYANMVAARVDEMSRVILLYGVANQSYYSEAWEGAHGEKCPLDDEQGAKSCSVSMNLIAVAETWDQLIREGVLGEDGPAALTAESITEMFDMLQRKEEERGN